LPARGNGCRFFRPAADFKPVRLPDYLADQIKPLGIVIQNRLVTSIFDVTKKLE